MPKLAGRRMVRSVTLHWAASLLKQKAGKHLAGCFWANKNNYLFENWINMNWCFFGKYDPTFHHLFGWGWGRKSFNKNPWNEWPRQQKNQKSSSLPTLLMFLVLCYSSWWFQPIWKNIQNGNFSPNRSEYENYLKPPLSTLSYRKVTNTTYT